MWPETKMGWRLMVLFNILISVCQSQLANRPPVFSPSPSSFAVDENEINEVLTTLQATDPDGDPVTFSIDINDYFDITSVNSTTVIVRSTRGIDYERNANLEFTVTATDTASDSRTPKQISVIVRDLNDNGPLFAQGDRSSFVIAENEPTGYKITDAFKVTDADTGANAETEISCFVDAVTPESRAACDTFELAARRVSNGNYAVDIILKRALDFETDRSYIMAVKAINVAAPSNFTTKNFVINVLDAQDQPPVFLKAPYSPVPYEELQVGTVIDVISVRDGDNEVQPARNLQLQLLNDTRNWLNLTPLVNNSGTFTSNLTVRGRIDREQYHNRPVYTVAVRVSELFADGLPDTTAVATSYINVQIFDINDNAPEFYTGAEYETQLIEPLVLNVREGLGVNTNLPAFLLSIIDIDIPQNNAFDVAVEGFGSDTFQLSPTFGTGSAVLSLLVKKEANMDYEKEEYRHLSLKLIATDRSGRTELTRTATVKINLIDRNDNFPHFSQGVYTVRVSPDESPNSPIITVSATDRDSGSFGSVTYSIVQASDLIRIDDSSGVVYLVSHPRDGSSSRYEVELVVTDGGGKSTTAQLVINFNNEFPERPVFDSHIYNATVYENRTNFNNEPVKVKASDPDSRVIIYSIVAGNTQDQVFQLHPTNGHLTLRRAILKQDGRQFDLTVRATDGELNDTAHIYIDLLDYNDYEPKFTKDNYAKVIPESTSIGTVILNITARDQDGDEEDGGIVLYDILSGDESQRFYIISTTGALGVNAELDYDTQNMFVLQVRAEDKGVPSKSTTAFVNITLTDVNNRLPQFSNELYIQYMSEDDPVGSRVIQVNAFDLDRGSELRYSIVADSFEAKDAFNRAVTITSSYDFRNAFSINEGTGEIVTLLSFNRELVSFISFQVVVIDINGQIPRDQRGIARVEVNIRQVGVGVPEFLNEPWTVTDQRIVVSIAEERVGLIVNLIAVDSLSRQRITRFREVAGDPENYFTVQLNGEVHLNRPLDYEQMISKTKRIIVDAITPSGEVSSATIEINVVNINDNSPEFSESAYTFSVAEGTYITRTRLGAVFATDKDGDTNFVYQLTGRYSNLFYINNQGNIYIREDAVMDAETTSRYDIYVQVTDRSVNGHTVSVPVTITVGNTNEHYPVCAQSVFVFFIPKSVNVGRRFGQVLATDQDAGDTVRYFLDSNAEKFAVDQRTGVISTASSLSNSEQASYIFTVRARDSISPYREALCQVNLIVISPDQSYLPIFTQPPNEGSSYIIEEESAFDTTVVKVEVRSADNTPLNNVIYSLSNTTDTLYFNIDSHTGRVYVLNSPDREVQQRYQLIVIARTNTTEVSRKFYVTLRDIDDHDPSFSECDLSYPMRLEVEEGELEQSTGEKLIGAIKACDKDDSDNAKIYYHIVNCNDGSTSSQSERFSINVQTGEITVDPATLDYEVSTTHTICVNASTSRTSANIRSDQWKIVISVKNKDDYELKFVRSTVAVVMGGNVGTGQEIIQIQASDRDVTSANGITYEIISISYVRGTETASGSSNQTIRSAFTINRFTGKITTNLPSYVNMIGGTFEVKIRAKTTTDVADLTLKIFVNHPTEQIILVFDRPPDVVDEFITEFFEELEAIHGYKFYVQKQAYHENTLTKQTYLNMTDVYLYVLDKDGNRVDYNTVARILQNTYSDRQAELFTKYGVMDGGPRTLPQTSATRIWLNWYQYEWIWWLIIASAIVLIIDALILIFCLLYLYNIFVKKPGRTAGNTIYLR